MPQSFRKCTFFDSLEIKSLLNGHHESVIGMYPSKWKTVCQCRKYPSSPNYLSLIEKKMPSFPKSDIISQKWEHDLKKRDVKSQYKELDKLGTSEPD